ncbi:MAG: TrbI/VirB10 family protein [Rhodanobacteraceae bacterium]
MSTTPPRRPDDARDGGRDQGGEPVSAHEAGRDSVAAADLDANAPLLRSGDLRRMNRRALGFLGATVILLLALAFLLLKSTGGAETPPKPRAETVQVPALPPQPQLPRPASESAIVMATPVALPVVSPAPPLPVLPAPPAQAQSGPSLLQRRGMADDSGDGGSAVRGSGVVGQGRAGTTGSGATHARLLTDPDTLMLRGTYIRCALETRIISDIPGFTSCVVTEPVYSFDGNHLLLPKGSRVFGEYNHGPVGSRIAVVWDRIVTPTGIDVSMSSPGVDNLGGAGMPGHLDSHWPSRIGSALLISLMSDAFLYEGEKHGPRTNNISPGGGFVVQTPFQSNTAQTLQNLANQAIQQSANRRATLTINQGSLIAIYVARDVDFAGVVARF